MGISFIIENPETSLCWELPGMVALAGLNGVFKVSFDQCQFGLKSKVAQTPMKKRTILMSNIPSLHQKFDGQLCAGLHSHVMVQGSEGGEKRSTWAQRYPDLMVSMIAQAVREHLSPLVPLSQ